jgi:hypothetical protein
VCFCGAVKIEVTGEPEGMGYCHCQSCRSWSAAPVNAFTLWKPEAVKVTAGTEHIGMFQKTPVSQRQYCKKCGGHLTRSIRDGARRGCGERLQMLMTRRSVALSMTRRVPGASFGG